MKLKMALMVTDTEAARLLTDFLSKYAAGHTRRLDFVYWEAMRWHLIRRGRDVAGVTDISAEAWRQKLIDRGMKA
jgi:hypothetical protein